MSLVLRHWSLDPALIGVALALVLYMTGYRRLARRRRQGSGRSMGVRRIQLAVFVAAMATVVVAVCSPIDYWSEDYFWVHMIQHILLMLVAPQLLVFSSPWKLFQWGLPVGARRAVGRAIFLSAPGTTARRVGRWLTRPVTAAVIVSVVMVGWHVPVLFDLALRNQSVHVYGEHLTYYLAGLLLYTAAIGTDYPAVHRTPVLPRIATLAVTGVVMWLLAMTLGLFATGSWYSPYRHLPGVTLQPFYSQQIGASLLWICGDFTLVPAILLLTWQYLTGDRETTLGELRARLTVAGRGTHRLRAEAAAEARAQGVAAPPAADQATLATTRHPSLPSSP